MNHRCLIIFFVLTAIISIHQILAKRSGDLCTKRFKLPAAKKGAGDGGVFRRLTLFRDGRKGNSPAAQKLARDPKQKKLDQRCTKLTQCCIKRCGKKKYDAVCDWPYASCTCVR